MNEAKYLSLDTSILYRCNQKYHEKLLVQYGIGYTHMLLMTQIYENEGISMNELAINGSFDKGTITKSIQRLEQAGYIVLENSEVDKRSKLLYTTPKAREILPSLYAQRQNWANYLLADLSEEEKEAYVSINNKLIEKAKLYNQTELQESDIRIFGFQKMTLLDYPGHMAATIFTGGCNFRCPFCHNRSLVFIQEAEQEIDQNEVLEYLEKRKKVLDGVCITGGEALIQPGLKDFIKKIKEKGLAVKLDTNGSFFEKLKDLIEEGLLDYVAMDIKNCKEKYDKTTGVSEIDLKDIEASVDYLKENHVDYEFRTTVTDELHDFEDFEKIGLWLKGAKAYYLQNFEDHGNCIVQGLHPKSIDDLKKAQAIVKKYIEKTELRGVE